MPEIDAAPVAESTTADGTEDPLNPWGDGSQQDLFEELMGDSAPDAVADGAGDVIEDEPVALAPDAEVDVPEQDSEQVDAAIETQQPTTASDEMPEWATSMVSLFQQQQAQMAAFQDVLKGQSELLASLKAPSEQPATSEPELDLSRILAAGLKSEYGTELGKDELGEVSRALALKHLSPEWGDNEDVQRLANAALSKARSHLQTGTLASKLQSKIDALESKIASLEAGTQRPAQRAEFSQRLVNAAIRERQLWPHLAQVVGDDGANVMAWLEHNEVDLNDKDSVLRNLSGLELDLEQLATEVKTHGAGPYKAALQRAGSPMAAFVDAFAQQAEHAQTKPPPDTGDKPPVVSRRKSKAGGVKPIPTDTERLHKTESLGDLYAIMMRQPAGGAPN